MSDGPSRDALRRTSMPLCTCGHTWGEHARPPDMDYDIDNGERWCYALTETGECRCKRYVKPPASQEPETAR